MEKNCERCFNKKAIFYCDSCPKYHNFCATCDNYIHSLNNNKLHKRQYIYSSNQDYSFNKRYFNVPENNTISSFYKFQTNYNPNYNITNISSIKNQIEEIQKNMTEQINKVLINIDNNNINLNYNEKIKELENNYKEKINNLILNKNNEIKDLEYEMNNLNKKNKKLINEIDDKNKENNIKIIEYTNIINNLQDELNKKEEEIINIKNNEKIKKNKNINEKEKEKESISKEYEKKINNILNISEHNQIKLRNVIKEKEIIIQNLININKNKKEQFNQFINKINEDNQDLKNIAEKSIGLAKYNLINDINK